MATISDVVECAPSAAFAVDDSLTIVGWNRAAEDGFGVRKAEALGSVCYKTIRAIDGETGRPCYERCPLFDKSLDHRRIHSRILEARWRDEEPSRLDCTLLPYATPSSEYGTLCFMAPMGAADAERYYRAIAAMDSLDRALTGVTDLTDSLRKAVRAVREATDADVAELTLFDHQTRKPFQVVRQALDPLDEAQPEMWLNREDLLNLTARHGGASTALLLLPDDSRVPNSRWYLAMPLNCGGRVPGVLSVGNRRGDFSIDSVARVLFVLAIQISALLRWATSPEPKRLLTDASDDAVSTPVLRFHCFGRFRVTVGGRDVSSRDIGRLKSLALLKVLVARRGHALHRDWLVEYLWPGADPSLARKNLRVVLHHLRRALDPALMNGRTSSFILAQEDLVYLDPSERCWVDVEEFDRLARRVDALVSRGQVDDALATAREAVTLYTADYLEDEPYIDWCIAERERLRNVYVDLLRRMAIIYDERDQLPFAIEACKRALTADGLREDVHSRLIDLLARAGRRDEALRQYEACRNVLWRELGVAPGEDLQNLYRTIRDRRCLDC